MIQGGRRMFSEKSRRRMREYWKSMMCSVHCKMARGAENLRKVIRHARGDNWRRNAHHSEKRFNHK